MLGRRSTYRLLGDNAVVGVGGHGLLLLGGVRGRHVEMCLLPKEEINSWQRGA